MTDRRRTTRFLVCSPAHGQAKVFVPVLVERLASNAATVVAPAPAQRGEQLVLHAPDGEGSLATWNALVRSSLPVRAGDPAGSRITLRLSATNDTSAASHRRDCQVVIAGVAEPFDGVLVRHHRAVVPNISPCGGLLAMREPLGHDAVGMLEVELQGGRHSRIFRVRRVTRIEGATVFYVAVQFLSVGAEGQALASGSLPATRCADVSAALPIGTRALSGWVLTSSMVRDTVSAAADTEADGNRRDLTDPPAATSDDDDGPPVAL